MRADAAQLIGNSGSAYRYGTTKVGGTTNMLSNGNVLYPAIDTGTQYFNNQDIELLLGGTFFDAIAQARNCWVDVPVQEQNAQVAYVIANGEFAFQDTTTGANHYGAASETFASPGTVTVVNGNSTITGALTTFTTSTLNVGYAYVPSLNKVVPGDIIEIVNGGLSQYYRITAITDATHLAVFPNYQAGGAAGLSYTLRRCGYGSWSRPVRSTPGAGSNPLYYAGNVVIGLPDGRVAGTINNVNGGAHFTCPQTSATLDIQAVDVAYYKSFLLYGFGTAISWSVAGFPTSVATGFGATDFPAGNITVVAPDDDFVCFEYIGDQLVALFRNSIWLIVPTGSIPEFSFYRLPAETGALLRGTIDAQLNGTPLSFTRPSCSGEAAAYFVSRRGLEALRGGVSTSLSAPVDSYDFPAGDQSSILSWDDSTASVVWADAAGGRCLIYRAQFDNWIVYDKTALGTVKGIAGSARINAAGGGYYQDWYRAFSVGYWNAKRVHLSASQIERELVVSSSTPWTWASPLVSVSELYDKFKFGGFTVWGRGPAGLSPANLTWTIYAGSSPYNVTVRGTGTFDYSLGSRAFDQRIGSTIDEAWIGVVLTGSNWIELAGVALWDAGETPGR
jgi:hypothetical protein